MRCYAILRSFTGIQCVHLVQEEVTMPTQEAKVNDFSIIMRCIYWSHHRHHHSHGEIIIDAFASCFIFFTPNIVVIPRSIYGALFSLIFVYVTGTVQRCGENGKSEIIIDACTSCVIPPPIYSGHS